MTIFYINGLILAAVSRVHTVFNICVCQANIKPNLYDTQIELVEFLITDHSQQICVAKSVRRLVSVFDREGRSSISGPIMLRTRWRRGKVSPSKLCQSLLLNQHDA